MTCSFARDVFDYLYDSEEFHDFFPYLENLNESEEKAIGVFEGEGNQNLFTDDSYYEDMIVYFRAVSENPLDSYEILHSILDFLRGSSFSTADYKYYNIKCDIMPTPESVTENYRKIIYMSILINRSKI